MIKRDGVALMNARTKNVSVAKETITILKDKQYINPHKNIVDISFELDESIKKTVLYKDQDFNLKHRFNFSVPVVEIVNETTTQAAVRLLQTKSDIVALNFASGTNPGGGFLGGSIAQEEDLARSSGLYFCLKSKPIFYNENILNDGTLYTDNIIYSPNVPFFRGEYNDLLLTPYLLSIISSPAPNVRSIEEIDEDILYNILYSRALKILQVAAMNGHRTIILGAWGCGAFGNSPKLVATAFFEALAALPAFDYVCFAVYDTKDNTPTYIAFKNVFVHVVHNITRNET